MLNRIKRKLFGKKISCNICNWEGDEFYGDDWHTGIICPNCKSQVRHRLAWAVMTKNSNIKTFFHNKTVLHFAPDKLLYDRIKPHCLRYHSADLLTEGYSYDHIDFNIDISNLNLINDNTYDIVIAFDVLEHVTDDKKALNEIYRVLRPNGIAILTVPQKDFLEKTYEDNTIIEPEKRKAAFGQFDHLRIYGTDFKQRLSQTGFSVEVFDAANFNSEQVKKNVLLPPLLSINPLATNYRKIYLATKHN